MSIQMARDRIASVLAAAVANLTQGAVLCLVTSGAGRRPQPLGGAHLLALMRGSTVADPSVMERVAFRLGAGLAYSVELAVHG